ncbi:B3 domain-containing protein REM22 [Cardamine amara subsp. amara]|uniref:B3 domain-containing protein REM22 n=1 Tax=Cardamine amara subsp. amara TaxID=228776 RepID=A0ABD1BY76_CARAN
MFDEYIDDEMNPSFPVDMTQNRTRIPAILIKDYNLKFPKLVIVRDKIGKLKRRITVWKNRSAFLTGIKSIARRNHLKLGDKMVCEIKMVDGYNGLVREIKVHIIKG